MFDWLILIVVMSAASYRIARFLVADSLIDGTRNHFQNWLGRPGEDDTEPALWRMKVADLIECPWCVTIWTSAGVVLVTWLFVNIMLPVLTWLAVATIALVWWTYIEEDDE